MNAVEVLSELRRRGIRVELRPAGKMRLAPASAVGPALLERVRDLKAELLILISDQAPRAERLIRDGSSSSRALDDSSKDSAISEPSAAEMSPAIATEIQRVESEALRLGWTCDRLWNAEFWRPWPRGLASVLEAGDQITEITSDFITVRKGDGRGATQRFWKSH
jgi:hypothetical protein